MRRLNERKEDEKEREGEKGYCRFVHKDGVLHVEAVLFSTRRAIFVGDNEVVDLISDLVDFHIGIK